MVVLVSVLYGASAAAYAGKTHAFQSAFPRKRVCNQMFHLLTYLSHTMHIFQISYTNSLWCNNTDNKKIL